MTQALNKGDIITFRHTTGFGLTLTLTGQITDIYNGKFHVQTFDEYRQHVIIPSQILALVRSAEQVA